MYRFTQDQALLQEYLLKRQEIIESIEFFKERISKLELQKLKSTSGGARRSLSYEQAIETLTELESKLSKALKQADADDSKNFDSYYKMHQWHEQTVRQLKHLKMKQRKRVNIFEFSTDLLEAIKDRVTIVDMLDELKIYKKRSGAARYVIICPFHDEKTPSCMVYVDQDRYHCFSCMADGDVIDFYKDFLDLEFDEALVQLSDKLGIVLMDEEVGDQADDLIKMYKESIEQCYNTLDKLKNNFKKRRVN